MSFIKNIKGVFGQLKPQLIQKTVMEAIRKVKEPSVQKQFATAKRDMIAAFKALPVVDALEYGPGYGDTDTLGILGGYGDLFSFLGFSRRQKPVNPIIRLLRGIKLVPAGSEGFNLKWQVTGFPTIDKIEEVTPLPWATFSWATALERGVPGLGRYLNKNNIGPPSRSRYGLQSKVVVRPDGPKTTKPIKWITPFLKEWRNALETLNNTKVL